MLISMLTYGLQNNSPCRPGYALGARIVSAFLQPRQGERPRQRFYPMGDLLIARKCSQSIKAVDSASSGRTFRVGDFRAKVTDTPFFSRKTSDQHKIKVFLCSSFPQHTMAYDNGGRKSGGKSTSAPPPVKACNYCRNSHVACDGYPLPPPATFFLLSRHLFYFLH
jgi:hypothetical protein